MLLSDAINYVDANGHSMNSKLFSENQDLHDWIHGYSTIFIFFFFFSEFDVSCLWLSV